MPLVKNAPHGLGNHPLHIGMFSALLQMMEEKQKRQKFALLSEKQVLFLASRV